MKGIGYLILIFTTLYMAILYDSEALVFLAGVEILLPLLLFLLLFAGNFLLTLSFVQNQWFWEDGETVSPVLCIRKRGILPIRQIRLRIRGRNETTGERYKKRVSLEADRGVNPPQEILLPQLGYGVWTLSLKWVQVFDYVQLFWLPHVPPKALSCLVLPKRHSIHVTARPGMARGGLMELSGRNRSWAYDRMNRGDLREYRPGDALKEIHWKLSAKRDQLLVWEKEHKEQGGWLVALDLRGWSSQKAELVYSLLYAMFTAHPRGAVWFRRQGEEELAFLEQEEELYLVMELLLSGALEPLEGEAARLDAEEAFWVREPLELWQGQQCLFAASDASLKELGGLELNL